MPRHTPAGVVHGTRPKGEGTVPAVITRTEAGTWTARVHDPESEYAEPGGYVTLGGGYPTAKKTAEVFGITI